MRKEEVLDKAFANAIRVINPAVVDPDVARQTMRTNMRAYVDGTYYKFTDSQIDRRITSWIQTINKAGKSHSHYNEFE